MTRSRKISVWQISKQVLCDKLDTYEVPIVWQTTKELSSASGQPRWFAKLFLDPSMNRKRNERQISAFANTLPSATPQSGKNLTTHNATWAEGLIVTTPTFFMQKSWLQPCETIVVQFLRGGQHIPQILRIQILVWDSYRGPLNLQDMQDSIQTCDSTQRTGRPSSVCTLHFASSLGLDDLSPDGLGEDWWAGMHMSPAKTWYGRISGSSVNTAPGPKSSAYQNVEFRIFRPTGI